MKVHLNWLRATAAAAIAAAGIGPCPAVAQVAPNVATQQTSPTYNYPATGYQAIPTSGIVAPGRAPQGTPASAVAARPTYAPAQTSTYQPSQGYAAAQRYATSPGQPAAHGYSAAQGYSTTQPAYAPYRPQSQPSYGATGRYRSATAPAAGYPTYVALGDNERGRNRDDDRNRRGRDERNMPEEALPPPTGGTASPAGDSSGERLPAPTDSGIDGYPGTPGYAGTANDYPGVAAGYPGGDCATGYQAPDYGISGYFDNPAYDSRWFGGVYFLYMERDNPSYTRFTSAVDTGSIMYPYYPQARTTVLSTDDVDFDYAPGVEVRFGSTFSVGDSYGCYDSYGAGYGGYGHGACGARGGGSCAPVDHYAWEVAWWGLDEDDQSVMVNNYFPDGPMRLYALRTHAGLSYDSGGGGRPVNDYYDYQMPIEDDMPPMPNDVRVIRQRVRTYFSAQNLELNFLRFPVCNVACGGGGCGYDTCGYDACGACDPCACEPVSAFSITGVCGVRYFRTDDDFEWANQWATYDGASFMPSMDELFHEIQVDNNLVGFQLGSSMNYAVGCRWNFFLDSTFGLFNNHIRHYQRVYGANGNYAFYEETGEGMNVRSTKNDVAMLGELRLGGAYNFTCNWRGVLAYRAIGITGMALSTDQLRAEYSNWADTARIDSDGSILIHGVQVGAECKY